MEKGFFRAVSRERFTELLTGLPRLGDRVESVPLDRAAGRILARDVLSPEDLPARTRSSMDGYAVRAADAFGASETNPAYLELAGSLRVDDQPDWSLKPGHCAGIVTGGTLPGGADAVVMVEHTHDMGGGTIEIRRAVAPADNVMLRGEDVAAGTLALARGTRLRPQELGLLAALGVTSVPVTSRLKAGLLSTGDEVVPADQTPGPGRIRDVNSHALAAMLAGVGAEVTSYGLAPDEQGAIEGLLGQALAENDVVFVSGGSSVGSRDLTLAAVAGLPDSEVLAHGVAISPGKPTILARVGAKVLFGLPGQVTSAQVIMRLFGLPFLEWAGGDDAAFERLQSPLRVRLARNVASKQGREDWVRVRLEPQAGADPPLARPILGKSGLLRTLLDADALIRIPADVEGLYEGAVVPALPL